MSKILSTGKCLFAAALLLGICGTVYGNTQPESTISFAEASDSASSEIDILLNRVEFAPGELDYYRKGRADDKPVQTNPEAWLSLYDRLRKGAHPRVMSRFPDWRSMMRDQEMGNSEADIIPIGIMDIEGEYAPENMASGKVAEKIRFLDASVLQETLYQAEASFKIGGALLVSNKPSLTGMEIDFGDGKGYKSYGLIEQVITHSFAATGPHSIQIRLRTEKGFHVFQTAVQVLQLRRRPAFRNYQISAQPIVQDTGTYWIGNARRSASVPGANVRIVLGCDQVFDKPVIVAEGMDLGENRYLDNLEAEYINAQNTLAAYMARGFDIVLVDWQNSHDYIQNNAQVLKAIITDVNETKVGDHQLIVIGESMGGLIARWALREMEVQNTPHQASHLICYDTPHQGANVPIGLTQLYWETPLDHFENHLVNFLPRFLYHYYYSLASPAARQMLIHWGGQVNIGVGNTHPDFFTFRSALTAMGHGGYPATCDNIAMIEGSLSAEDRSLFDEFNYGDRIMLGWLPGFRRSTHFDVHTNALNDEKSITRLFITQIPPKFPTFVMKDIKYDSPLNDDFLPGGKSSISVRVLKFLATKTFDFCFVPTFSSIDFSGARDTQDEREILNVHDVLPIQMPFSAVYGHATDRNGFHVAPQLLPWRVMGIAEGILSPDPSCPAAPIPPAPNIYFSQSYCFPFTETRTDQSFPITVNVAAMGQEYRQTLLIEKLGSLETQEGFLMSDQTSFTFYVFTAGQYRVTCERSYPGRPDLTSTASATVNVSNCPDLLTLIGDNNSFNPIDCQGFWEGDYLLTFQNDTTKHAFAHLENDILYATLEKDDAFVPRSVLMANHLFEEYALCFAETDPRALPVTLATFDAGPTEGKVVLTWQTASETNSAWFEIMRSPDGHHWQATGKIAARNAGETVSNYVFVDSLPLPGTSYYRLKMIDSNSSYAYSRIRRVQFADTQIIVYPNPIDDGMSLRLSVGDANVKEITVSDLAGRVVYRADSVAQIHDAKMLMAGRYILKIRMKDGSETSRVIVKR